ncbi:MAG: O-antigen ligase family protein [Thermoanaerobaculia bacterium]
MPSRSRIDPRAFLADAFAGAWPRRIALGLLVAYVLAAPFPWGSVQPGLTGTAKITLGAFLIAGVAALSPGARLRLGEARLPLAAVAGIAALGLLQVVPLPGALLRAFSPASAEAWAGAGRILGTFGRTAPPARISLMPWETLGVSLLAFSWVALFLAASALLDRRASRRLFAGAVVVSGLVQVGLAIATEDRLLRLHGSFVNPNNLAGYLQISLAFALGLLWYRTRLGLQELSEAHGAEERSSLLVSLLPSLGSATLLWAVLAAGIVLSQSRGGIVAATGTTLLLGTLVFQSRRGARRARRVVGIALAALVTLGTAFAIAGAGTVAFLRFLMPDAADLAADYRVLIWRGSVEAFRLFPWLGSGLGTFREAFRRVQPQELNGLVDQAHDEYLQLLVTGGAIGAALGLVALVLGLRALLRAFFAQKHREERAWGLAGIGALVALLLHGIAEFNFSIPAIPATLAACLGGAWAALGWTRSDDLEPSGLSDPGRSGPSSR